MGMGLPSYAVFRQMEVRNQVTYITLCCTDHLARFAVSIIAGNTDVHFMTLSNHGLFKNTILS